MSLTSNASSCSTMRTSSHGIDEGAGTREPASEAVFVRNSRHLRAFSAPGTDRYDRRQDIDRGGSMKIRSFTRILAFATVLISPWQRALAQEPYPVKGTFVRFRNILGTDIPSCVAGDPICTVPFDFASGDPRFSGNPTVTITVPATILAGMKTDVPG